MTALFGGMQPNLSNWFLSIRSIRVWVKILIVVTARIAPSNEPTDSV